MSHQQNEAFLESAFERMKDIWDSANEKQRNILIMFSQAPLNTPRAKNWDELPGYNQSKLFDSFMEKR